MPYVTSNLVFALDAADSASYSGSGQTWANLHASPADGSGQTAYDFYRGTGSGSESADASFVGTAGADPAYFSFDGDDLLSLAGSMTTFLQQMHHSGKQWTIELWVDVPSSNQSNINPFFDSGTSYVSGNDMSSGVIYADLGGIHVTTRQHQIRVQQDGGPSHALIKTADAQISAGLHMLACSIDGSGGSNSFLYKDGDYDPVSSSNTWDGTFSSPGSTAASNKARIGARGDALAFVPNGAKVYLIRVYNTNLSKADLDQNYANDVNRIILFQSGTATAISPGTTFGTPLAIPDAICDASGFTSTAFGTPMAIYDHFGDASGFTGTTFGTPTVRITQAATGTEFATTFGTATGFERFPATTIGQVTQFGTPSLMPVHPVGFQSGAFGTPNAVWDQIAVASSIEPATAFGEPHRVTFVQASSVLPSTVVSTAYFAFNQTLVGEGALMPTRWGHATAVRRTAEELDRSVRAQFIRSTQMGRPTAVASIDCAATALGPTANFGTPEADQSERCEASALGPVGNIGTPTARLGQDADGFRATAFGTPIAKVTVHPDSVYRATRFGLPEHFCPYRTYGFSVAGRFGCPTAIVRMNGKAASGFMSTALGTPTATLRYRARHAAPSTRFGTPTIRRTAP